MYTVNLNKLKKNAPGRMVCTVRAGTIQHQRVIANRDARWRREQEKTKRRAA